MMNSPEDQLKKLHLLERTEQDALLNELRVSNPSILRPFVPKWWWWRRCRTRILVVCDGALNFGTGGFDLSVFLTIFSELESGSFVDYQVTLAHRQTATMSTNPTVVNHISNFKFDTSVNLADFDQVWIFGIQSSGSITADEIKAIEGYMNGGGGLFATGDHGALGRTMSGQIPRVKDMRYWDNSSNEVGMRDARRNDTNMPRPGETSASTFDHQSDIYPQTIAARVFSGGFPHPLLSISPSIRPSGVIDIMPDHPHEGECTHETSFTVGGTSISSQIIATSFVRGGNVAVGKEPTQPHCFPSISVWDGRRANAGRIVIDSTWHHFVNINLNGAGSPESGLNPGELTVIKQYYKNIALWMTRRILWGCWRPWILFDLAVNSQIVEANLDNPDQSVDEVKLSDLKSIGTLAESVLGAKFSPAFAREFFVDITKEVHQGFGEAMDPWSPHDEQDKDREEDDHWLKTDTLFHAVIGAGFVLAREAVENQKDESVLKSLDKALKTGMDHGFRKSLDSLNKSISRMKELL